MEHEGKSLHEMIPVEYAVRHKMVPVSCDDGVLKIGLMNPGDTQLIQDLEFISGLRIEAVEMDEETIQEQLESFYGYTRDRLNTAISPLGEFQVIEKEEKIAGTAEFRKEIDELSVVTLVNQIITNAIDSGASDIHIEAYEDIFRVRYRLDGVLQEVMNPPVEKKRAIVSRLKIMASLDIAEKRRPQDGRIRVKRDHHVIDIRLSTLPTDFGEKVVMRILDKARLNLDLAKLGFDARELALFREMVQLPYGMILVTGPTGSGKTTTLYATLNYLNAPEVNIQTVEDPIEYNLAGINQSQVKTDIGYTFAAALRSFLRQDPDIIMVGEIRDQETAEIAIRAALTGHMVFSTLHTNNAPDTLTRLMDMDQEPYLIASSVKMIIAQRLLRKICTHCKTEMTDAHQRKELFRVFPDVSHETTFYYGKGCKKCSKTGYASRTAVFEIMPITPALSEAIHHRAAAPDLKRIACEEGMRTLHESALARLCEGVTTVEEVLRETEG